MSFEDVMMKRLANCHAEACDEVLKSVKAGRALGDAVLDAIEALPKSKSRDLRRWLEDWEAWETWLIFKKDGWRVKRERGGRVKVTAPRYIDKEPWTKQPPVAVIATAAGVRALHWQASLWTRDREGDPVSAYFRITQP